MPKTKNSAQTPLSRELQRDEPGRRITPADAFKLAVHKWQNGERIDIGAIAAELGVGKATLFRWVGSRDLLLGEIIWSQARLSWDSAVSKAKGVGADYGADVTYRFMQSVLASESLRRFINSGPEQALRILTGKGSLVQSRFIDELVRMIAQQTQAGHLASVMPVDEMAYLIVRLVESCLYSDQITGRKPNVDIACAAIRILLSARPAAEQALKTRKASAPEASPGRSQRRRRTEPRVR